MNLCWVYIWFFTFWLCISNTHHYILVTDDYKKCFLLTFKAEQPQRMCPALLMSLMHYFDFLNITKQNKLMHRCNFEYLIALNSWCIIFILNIPLMHSTSWQFFTFLQWTKNNLSLFQKMKLCWYGMGVSNEIVFKYMNQIMSVQ